MSVLFAQQRRVHVLLRALVVVTLLAAAVVVRWEGSVRADAPPSSPYSIVPAVDTNPAPDVFETTIVAKTATIDIGNGVKANMWTYNGIVPGPEFRLKVGDTVIVHFRNELPRRSGIHWHGIELNNASDGTSLTENGVPTGGSFLYRFTVPRPGIFWYHPHHMPTNPVFKGQYGSIVVPDPHEETLIQKGVLPTADRTRTMVFSDTTVCKQPGTNDTDTYDDSLPWAGGGPLPEQRPPYPSTLCDTPVDEHGNPIRDANGRAIPLAAGDIPNIQRFGTASFGRTNEGQTVLSNGRNTGARAGSPEAPGAVAEGATSIDLPAGQGIRVQAVNAAAVRFFRLRMTDSAGRQIPLVRVGAEGGLLDHARTEGGTTAPEGVVTFTGPFNTKYAAGELVLTPSDRSDFVVSVPRDTPAGVATLWTLDYNRTGEEWTYVPTVPVMHLNITPATSESYSLAEGAPLRAHPDVMDPVERLGAPRTGLFPDMTGISPLLDPATFSPPKPGSADEDIRLTTDAIRKGPGIDDVEGTHDAEGVDYTAIPHTASTRYGRLGDMLELTVTNETAAHHAFHFHGFSFQPLSYERQFGPNYVFPYREFVDTIDVPAGYMLRFRVRLDDRPQMDGVTPGGGLGRWVFHCHIFFHATHGMQAEFVVVAPDGNEKPYVNADTTGVVVDEGGTASATGTYVDTDGDPVALSASRGSVRDLGGGRWAWQENVGAAAGTGTVYITGTDPDGFTGQVAFDLAVVNAPPAVAITGPPDGSSYAVGSTVTVTAAVDDAGGGSGLTCRFDWDDGLGLGDPVPVVGGTCTQSKALTQAGGYTVKVVGADGEGASASDSTLVVVYDPAAGTVQGSGTIDSPAGAYAAAPSTTGPALFDLMSRYKKGETAPTGKLRFTFGVGAFDFRASAQEWLVVAGPRAQVRGTGAVGGVEGHGFLLTVVDGAGSGTGEPDRFRLKVWNGSGTVVYDNAPGAPDDIDTAAPAPIASGDVVINS